MKLTLRLALVIVAHVADEGRPLPKLGVAPAGITARLAQVVQVLSEVGLHPKIDIRAGQIHVGIDAHAADDGHVESLVPHQGQVRFQGKEGFLILHPG
jgi:hypothetical protein